RHDSETQPAERRERRHRAPVEIEPRRTLADGPFGSRRQSPVRRIVVRHAAGAPAFVAVWRLLRRVLMELLRLPIAAPVPLMVHDPTGVFDWHRSAVRVDEEVHVYTNPGETINLIESAELSKCFAVEDDEVPRGAVVQRRPEPGMRFG